MAKTSDQKRTEDLMDVWGSSRVSIFFQTTGMVVVLTALFAVVGYYLDQWLGTFPGFFIAGIVIAFPAVQFALYKKFKSYSKVKLDNLKD
ncbi:MAG: F0F1-type ATP synthase assembly protein I [Oceanicoccus sp.]|jgi:F0F1-type ATP synthase assembly protein I